jgi:hypothetical protein
VLSESHVLIAATGRVDEKLSMAQELLPEPAQYVWNNTKGWDGATIVAAINSGRSG